MTISRFHVSLFGGRARPYGRGGGLHGVSLPRTLSAVCPLYIIYIYECRSVIILCTEECTRHAVLSTEF